MKKTITLLLLALLLWSCNVEELSDSNSSQQEQQVSLSGKIYKFVAKDYSIGDGINPYTFETEYFYDDNGNLVKELNNRYDDKGTLTGNCITERQYVEDRVSKEEISYYENGVLSNYESIEYNEYNYEVKKISHCYINGVFDSLSSWTYEYTYEGTYLKSLKSYGYINENTTFLRFHSYGNKEELNETGYLDYYNQDGTIDYSKSSKVELFYNSNDKLIERKIYKYDENNTLYLETDYKCEYDNNLNETMYYFANYDITGEILSIDCIKIEYEYDSNNNILSKTNYSEDEKGNKEKKAKVEYTYDSNNNVLTFVSYTYKNNIARKDKEDIYVYDENDNVIEHTDITYTEAHGYNIKSTYIYTYQHDGNNNLISEKQGKNENNYSLKERTYNENGDILTVTYIACQKGVEKIYYTENYYYYE